MYKISSFLLKKVEELCKKYDLLLIIDEVMSGFCRTGKWFGFQNHGIKPDIITIAKGVTSGYIPLGGVMISDKIINSFNDKFLRLGLTYSAHCVECAAAVCVLDIYENEKIIENVNKIGSYTDRKVEELINKHPSIGDWRNTGMLGCIELVKNRKNKDPLAPFNANSKEMEDMNKVIRKLRDEGMFTYTKWNYIFIAPPLTSSEEDIDEGIDIISKALKVADEFCY